MTLQTSNGSGIVGCATLALALALLAPAISLAATTPIYKCFDKNLGLLYTDEPCKDGEQLNIRAGDADPAAVARLERQREALDQSAAQRIADARRNAAQQDFAAFYPSVDERSAYDDMAANASYDYGLLGGYSGGRRPHPKKPYQPRPLEPRRVVLVAPHTVPLR